MATNEKLIELAKLIGSKQHDDNNKLIKTRMKNLTLSETVLSEIGQAFVTGDPIAILLYDDYHVTELTNGDC